jgi:NTP pyrophosphatase (non-canonical NTP hydrolase)
VTPNEYLRASERTDLPFYTTVRERCSYAGAPVLPLLHAAIGISTESGEILDVMKKHLMYGKDIDRVNIAEEVGDVLWYVAIILRSLDLSFEDVMEMNINKLQKRFPEKFTNEQALNRDLKTERQQLEESFKPQHLVGE